MGLLAEGMDPFADTNTDCWIDNVEDNNSHEVSFNMPPAVGIEDNNHAVPFKMPSAVGIDTHTTTGCKRKFDSEEVGASTRRKSNKFKYDSSSVVVFGSFPLESVPKASNRRLLQVIHGMLDVNSTGFRRIFDSDPVMMDSFYSDIFTEMIGVVAKKGLMLDSESLIMIPQKCIKAVLMKGGEKYIKIVRYVKQDINGTDVFSALEINSLLGHFSKNVASLYRDFPRFSFEKIDKMAVLKIIK